MHRIDYTEYRRAAGIIAAHSVTSFKYGEKGFMKLPILHTIQPGQLWGVLSPFIISLALTFFLALGLFYIAMRMTPGKKQRAFSILTLILIPGSLILFLYIFLSMN